MLNHDMGAASAQLCTYVDVVLWETTHYANCVTLARVYQHVWIKCDLCWKLLWFITGEVANISLHGHDKAAFFVCPGCECLTP